MSSVEMLVAIPTDGQRIVPPNGYTECAALTSSHVRVHFLKTRLLTHPPFSFLTQPLTLAKRANLYFGCFCLMMTEAVPPAQTYGAFSELLESQCEPI
jgi:hypothetical protein